MRNRGTLTLPKKIRNKYRIEYGDPLTLIDSAVMISGSFSFYGWVQSPDPSLNLKIVNLGELLHIIQKLN